MNDIEIGKLWTKQVPEGFKVVMIKMTNDKGPGLSITKEYSKGILFKGIYPWAYAKKPSTEEIKKILNKACKEIDEAEKNKDYKDVEWIC